ncbi:MAG TPA: cobalt ABC transporter, partial [Sulfitobacter pontiacus]|nr:cobalt ABC transporter [Sulfitobacter pontiacus]
PQVTQAFVAQMQEIGESDDFTHLPG